MKILQYNDSFDIVGGAEKYYIELSEELINYNIDTYRVGLTTKDYPLNTLKNYEFPIKVSPYKWHLPFNYKVYKKFKKILSNDEIFNQMMLTISPQKKLLKKLLDFFQAEYKKYPKKKIYKTLSDLLSKKI